ncbi:MAG TPA: UpxY family transcription antiterminator [Bacteroidales bacterium]|nr:UpxY family transcription antiterminator [Bacteroidales bacterium]
MNWFAVYTNPRAEKKAHADLLEKGIEAYLPLERKLKQWSDRKKWVEEPLFRSYIFVRIPPARYFDVLNTTGIVRYITFEGKAVAVPQNQIDAIKYYLSETETMPEEPDLKDLKPGAAVEIIRGPLRGLTGQLIEFQGRRKVRIEIEALGQFLNLNIDVKDLRIIR